MGVPGLFGYIRKNYSGVLKEIQNDETIEEKVDSLCYDLNGIIHNATQQVYHYGKYELKFYPKPTHPPLADNPENQERCFELIWSLIMDVYNTVKPEKRVIISIDGPAGVSKAVQQRSRRYRGGLERKAKLDSSHFLSRFKGRLFDSACITPGTVFMNDLSTFLRRKIQHTLLHDWSHLEEVIFSGEKVPGEGEHGLISYIRYNSDHSKPETLERYCIHGSDADLVMLGLSLHMPELYILRDSDRPYFQKYHLISVHTLYKHICKDLMSASGESSEIAPSSPVCRQLIEDFIFFSFLIGNDFLPHSPSVDIFSDGLDILFEVYRKLKGQRMVIRKDQSARFNPVALRIFLQYVSEKEPEMLEHIANDPSHYRDELLEKYTTTHGYEDNAIKKVDFEGFRNEYNSVKFETDIRSACVDFLDGMQWVLEYYLQGIPSWRWYYPHLYSPFATDILSALDDYKFKFYGITYPRKPWEQLLAVLPPTSMHLIPKPLRSIMSDKKYFPETIEIDLGRTKASWQGVVQLPFIPDDWLTEQYNSKIKLVSDQASNGTEPTERYHWTTDGDERRISIAHIHYM